jgi:co-chaperonin GroES (HSP10)
VNQRNRSKLHGQFVDPSGTPIVSDHVMTDTTPKVKERPPTVVVAMGNHLVFWYNRERAERATRAGLVLPDQSKDNYETPVFEVLSVGEQCKSGVVVGDLVFAYGEARVTKHLFNGQEWEFLACPEDKIIGRINTSHPEWQRVYGTPDDQSKQ